MKDNLTLILAILDRSGSMQHLTSDTIGGFNEFIDKQKTIPGEAIITTVLFDDEYEVLHDWVNLKKVKPITNKEYFARGQTSLLDAIGKTLNTAGGRLSMMDESERPSKVIVLIVTDGEENNSTEFKDTQIKEMVELQRNTYSWEFIFLGANIDSFAVAENIGIAHTANFSASNIGTRSVYRALSCAVDNFRSRGNVDNGESWEEEVE